MESAQASYQFHSACDKKLLSATASLFLPWFLTTSGRN